jgi:hypothetical protein
MLYRKIIAVCSEIHTKHINTLCGKKAEFVKVKPGGTYSEQWNLYYYSNQLYPQLWTATVLNLLCSTLPDL